MPTATWVPGSKTATVNMMHSHPCMGDNEAVTRGLSDHPWHCDQQAYPLAVAWPATRTAAPTRRSWLLAARKEQQDGDLSLVLSAQLMLLRPCSDSWVVVDGAEDAGTWLPLCLRIHLHRFAVCTPATSSGLVVCHPSHPSTAYPWTVCDDMQPVLHCCMSVLIDVLNTLYEPAQGHLCCQHSALQRSQQVPVLQHRSSMASSNLYAPLDISGYCVLITGVSDERGSSRASGLQSKVTGQLLELAMASMKPSMMSC